MNLMPANDQVIVKPEKVKDKTKGGIIIPQVHQEPLAKGVIIAVGVGKWTSDGRIFPLESDVGDEVYYKPGMYVHEIEHEGEKYIVMSESSVLSFINKKRNFDQKLKDIGWGLDKETGKE